MSTSQNRDHGQVPSSITTPDVVQSKIGRLEFADGYPTAETATRLRDEMNYLHGVQAFMNSIQGVSLWALRKGFADVGVADNEFIVFSELMDSKSLFLTANADTVYFWGNVSLADGPMANRSRQGMVPAPAAVFAAAGVPRQDLARRRDRPRRVEQPRT
jgi:hypothetical protein